MNRREFTKIAAGTAASLLASSAQDVFAQPELKIDVMSHYCNWHGMGSWGIAATYPLKGAYDSYDRNVIHQHNLEMANYGITPAVSWWGNNTGHTADDRFLDVYTQMNNEVKAAILYEATLLLKESPEASQSLRALGDRSNPARLASKNALSGGYDFNDPENKQRFVRDIDFLSTKYFESDRKNRMYHIDGKPVVFIWISHAFKGPFQNAVREARNYGDFYLIGSNFGFGGIADEHKEFLPAFDAISAYSVYDPNAIVQSGGPNARYVDMYKQSVQRWVQYLSRETDNTKLILPISFAFDNTHGTTRQQNMPYYMTVEEAAYFTQTVKDLIVSSNQGFSRTIKPYVMHVSWNEHFEGTPAEPSTHLSSTHARSYNGNNDGYGDAPYSGEYANILKENFKEPVKLVREPHTRFDPQI